MAGRGAGTWVRRITCDASVCEKGSLLSDLARWRKGDSVRRFSLVSAAVVWVTAFVLLAGSSISGQEHSGGQVFLGAKCFAGHPQNPYAQAVAIRGAKILALGK